VFETVCDAVQRSAASVIDDDTSNHELKVIIADAECLHQYHAHSAQRNTAQVHYLTHGAEVVDNNGTVNGVFDPTREAVGEAKRVIFETRAPEVSHL
jgi:hypothetical protein